MIIKDNRGVANVVGELMLIVITLALAAIVAAFVFGYTGILVKKTIPAFSVTREGDNLSVVLYDKMGASEIEDLLVKSPEVSAKGSLNNTEPTEEIEIGDVLRSIDVKAGSHYVVNGTVNGENMVVIDCRI